MGNTIEWPKKTRQGNGKHSKYSATSRNSSEKKRARQSRKMENHSRTLLLFSYMKSPENQSQVMKHMDIKLNLRKRLKNLNLGQSEQMENRNQSLEERLIANLPNLL